MHEKLQQSIDEINGKLVAKASGKIWRATKSGAKKTGEVAKKAGSFAKDSLHRGAVTAQNAIVAGIAAPIGVKASDRLYNQPKKKKEKEKKYSQSELAAYATAMKKNESLSITEDNIISKIKANLADFAKTESEAYLKAKEASEKIQAEYKRTQNEQSIKHPLLQAMKTSIQIYGKVFIAMLVGLLIIAIYSGRVKDPFKFITVVADTVKPNLLNDCLLLMGVTGGFNVMRNMLNRNKSVTERLQEDLRILEDAQEKKQESGIKKVAKGAAKGAAAGTIGGAAVGAGMAGGLAHKAATTLGATGRKGIGKIIRRGVTGAAGAAGGLYGGVSGGLKGLALGAAAAGVAHAASKMRKKKTNEALESLREAANNFKKKSIEGALKTQKAKDILKGSPAVKKALRNAQIKGGLKGAAITAGLGAAAYGVHKLRNQDV